MQRRRLGWQRLAVKGRCRPGHAGIAGDRIHRGGRVSGEDLQLDVLCARRTRPCRPHSAAAAPRARQARVHAHRRERRLGARGRTAVPRSARARARAALDRPRRAPVRQAPDRRSRTVRERLEQGVRRRGRGRSSAAVRRTAPARRRAASPTSASSASAIASRVSVARRGAGGVFRQRARQRLLLHRPRPATRPDHPQRRLGQRPGLVGADQVYRCERLDRVELLSEHPPLGDLERRHRRRQADQEDQTLGDKVHDAGGQGLDPRRRPPRPG